MQNNLMFSKKTEEFLQDPDKKVLLIKGEPGTGKTLCV
jgi:KaiC/GvpD/RAD55 family RecA-like ATPase